MKEWKIDRKQDSAEIGDEFYISSTSGNDDNTWRFRFTYLGTDNKSIHIRLVEEIKTMGNIKTRDSILFLLPLNKQTAIFKPRKHYLMHDIEFTLVDNFGKISINYAEQ